MPPNHAPPNNSPRKQQRRDTRKLMLWTAGVGAVLLIAFSLWPLLPSPETGAPPSGDRSSQNVDMTPGGPPAQRAAESAAGRSDPARPEDETGGKARAIQQTSQQLTLDQQQREQLKQIVSKPDAPRLDSAGFELMVGAAVPRQVPTRELPQDASRVLNGYWGDEYVLVQDRLVVVDKESRRVVAIVPGMA